MAPRRHAPRPPERPVAEASLSILGVLCYRDARCAFAVQEISAAILAAPRTGAQEGIVVTAPIGKLRVRALVAEDSAILLQSIELSLARLDIELVGAAATLASLLKMVESQSPDIAILNVNLNGEMVFPAADLLIARGVRILFVTGYTPEDTFPPHLLQLPTLQRPYDTDEFLRMVGDAIKPPGHEVEVTTRGITETEAQYSK